MTTETLKKRIGKNLQAIRKAKGYRSANAFADKMGIPRGTYVEYEQGRVSLPMERAWEFADDLGITIDELVGRPVPRRSFPDHRQEQLNECYEELNEKSKTEVSNIVKSIAADPSRRIEKSGEDSDVSEESVA